LSRSYKKHSYCGITTCRSEKPDKQLWHRAYRRVCRICIRSGVYSLPHYRLYSNPWAMGKDGKHWFDPTSHPKLLRK
jgi:hypothetical protein